MIKSNNLKLYLVRHAKAKKDYEDPARPLSKKGRKDAEKLAKFLKKQDITPHRIFHSGIMRAKETAEIINKNLSSELVEDKTLGPSFDPFIYVDKLKRDIKEDTMIIGHMPHLANLLCLMLTKTPNSFLIKFKTCSVVCLERDDKDEWYLDWMITPELL
ncbi:MAG: phosphohistidine phosphatase SixA [Candidatus Methanoliparum thermophilum]|uniref:Phosphohistidine phosphatase SixA n=1 Tax=Methanoliparum thermophilum TaxID=2491083 RepID=A0A520KRM0_METT2|nr:phosphohistidine phosphatase SixA [Candidatus Methanoliparum sp. LAM-1]RZN64441.1 MAG: phosphohistidine phosphatase SixA [Candidatus Methanoliparum thermophilum]BDC35972.1 phosphohistidine phosphatase SixA [Candidatus Methanoliparum sp. LAM-1]